MRKRSAAILVGVILSMLSIQFGGLHYHQSLSDASDGIHGTHLHQADPDIHNHESDFDVSFFELGVAWSKVMPFLIMLVVSLLATGRNVHSVIFPHTDLLIPNRISRWRPPLRAPPIPA